MVLGFDPMELMAMTDPTDFIIAQAVVNAGEKYLDDLIGRLAVKIRNEVIEGLNA